jgi:hypothetical protein
MRFAMLINDDPVAREQIPADIAAAAMQETYAWLDKWDAAGKLADGRAQLQHPRTARTIRTDAAGNTVVTDGPYLELKEVIGGVVFLTAVDLDDAIAVASTWPGLRRPGTSVEVRPVVEHG